MKQLIKIFLLLCTTLACFILLRFYFRADVREAVDAIFDENSTFTDRDIILWAERSNEMIPITSQSFENAVNLPESFFDSPFMVDSCASAWEIHCLRRVGSDKIVEYAFYPVFLDNSPGAFLVHAGDSIFDSQPSPVHCLIAEASNPFYRIESEPTVGNGISYSIESDFGYSGFFGMQNEGLVRKRIVSAFIIP